MRPSINALLIVGVILFLGVGVFGGTNCYRYVPPEGIAHLDGRIITPEKLKEMQADHQEQKEKAARGDGALLPYPWALTLATVGWGGVVILLICLFVRNVD